MSVEIAWKQNILVTDFQLLKSLLVVLGFGSQAFICGFSRQNICSVDEMSNSKLEEGCSFKKDITPLSTHRGVCPLKIFFPPYYSCLWINSICLSRTM